MGQRCASKRPASSRAGQGWGQGGAGWPGGEGVGKALCSPSEGAATKKYVACGTMRKMTVSKKFKSFKKNAKKCKTSQICEKKWVNDEKSVCMKKTCTKMHVLKGILEGQPGLTTDPHFMRATCPPMLFDKYFVTPPRGEWDGNFRGGPCW